VDVPEEIDLDTFPGYLDEIMNGSFMNFVCSSCGKKHKPEFPIILRWPSRNCAFEVNKWIIFVNSTFYWR
jgi:hypothetical protein